MTVYSTVICVSLGYFCTYQFLVPAVELKIEQAPTKMSVYKLTVAPEVIERENTHFVFVEAEGLLGAAAQFCWIEMFTKYVANLQANNEFTVLSNISMFKTKPVSVYRAGCALSKYPSTLDEGLKYEFAAGGKYARFTVTGPYSTLPEAREQVFQIIEETKMDVRDAFMVGCYGNDPKDTPEEELVTYILVPIN